MPSALAPSEAPSVFASRATCAARCEVSVDTWDLWVRDGFVPPAAIEHGQIKRWHWPSIEARLAAAPETVKSDEYLTGVRRA